MATDTRLYVGSGVPLPEQLTIGWRSTGDLPTVQYTFLPAHDFRWGVLPLCGACVVEWFAPWAVVACVSLPKQLTSSVLAAARLASANPIDCPQSAV